MVRIPRIERQFHNRVLFRSVNERVARLAAQLVVDDVTHGFVCECPKLGCIDQIQIPLDVYHRVQDMSSGYLVRAGHEDVASDEVVETGDGYLIVVERHD